MAASNYSNADYVLRGSRNEEEESESESSTNNKRHSSGVWSGSAANAVNPDNDPGEHQQTGQWDP